MLLLQQLINGFLTSGIYALFAVGFAMVFGIMGVLNMTHADFAMIGAIAVTLLVGAGISPFLAFPAAIICVALVAMIVERVAIRPARQAKADAAIEMPLIATIGAGMILQNVGSLLVGNRPVTFPFWLIGYLDVGGLQVSKALLISAGVAAALLVLLEIVVGGTDFGRRLRAVAQNQHAALIMGINAKRVLVQVIVLTASLSGVAGFLVGMSYGFISPFMGLSLAIKGLIAMIIGGIGSLRGAVLGAVVLGLIESVAVNYLGSTLRDFAVFVVLILVLLIKPTGLVGARATR